MFRLLKFILTDLVKNKVLIAYTLLLMGFSMAAFGLEDREDKAFLSLLNLILLCVPLMSMLFTTIYLYNSSEYIELMVAQPIPRKNIWSGLFTGICVSFTLANFIGLGLPLLAFSASSNAWMLLFTTILLSMACVALAFLATVYSKDKAKGIGFVLLLWLYLALLFDGLLLFLMFQFADYPIESAMVILSATNPIDLSRIMVLLNLETSSILGYTGAIFNSYFGGSGGLLVGFTMIATWIVVPFLISLRKFSKKDL